VKRQRSLNFHSCGRCFVPLVPKKEGIQSRSTHVQNLSRMFGGLSIGYLRLSAEQNLGFPGNWTGWTNPSGRPVRSGALWTSRTGPDVRVGHRKTIVPSKFSLAFRAYFAGIVIPFAIRGMAFANGQGIVACLPFP